MGRENNSTSSCRLAATDKGARDGSQDTAQPLIPGRGDERVHVRLTREQLNGSELSWQSLSPAMSPSRACTASLRVQPRLSHRGTSTTAITMYLPVDSRCCECTSSWGSEYLDDKHLRICFMTATTPTHTHTDTLEHDHHVTHLMQRVH
jgi:hypothetical protein